MKKVIWIVATASVLLYGAAVNGWLDLPAMAVPANPAAGTGRLFINSSTGKLACVAPDGTDCMPAAAGASGGTGISLGGVTVSGAKYVNPHTVLTTQTDATMYTEPAGRRAMVLNMHWYVNGGTSGNVLAKIRVSGTLYAVTAPQSNGGGGATNAFAIGIVLEPGEDLVASTQYTPGTADVYASVVEFDSTSPVKTKKVVSVVNGGNTLYTVPAGKSAILMSGPFYGYGVGTNGTFQNGNLHWVNNTGGGASVLYKLNGASLATSGFLGNA